MELTFDDYYEVVVQYLVHKGWLQSPDAEQTRKDYDNGILPVDCADMFIKQWECR